MTAAPNAFSDGRPLLLALLERAPSPGAVLTDEELIVECSAGRPDGLLSGAVRGSPARPLLTARVGKGWIARIDRVRRTGERASGSVVADGRCWTFWIDRIDVRRVAFYSRRLCPSTDARPLIAEAREALHALKNPLYGISAATDVLLSSTAEAPPRDVLEGMKEAAGQAESCLKTLAEILTTMELRAEREET